MNFEIGLEAFRCFRTQTYVPIRPITLLVGENSSGKTSLLASIKYVNDILNNESGASFNDEPFQLGTFDHIAFKDKEGEGSFREFKIKVRKNISVLDSPENMEKHSYSESELIIVLSGDASKIVLKGFEFQARGTKLIMSQDTVDPEREKWKFIFENGKNFVIPSRSFNLKSMRGPTLAFVPYQFDRRKSLIRGENGVALPARRAHAEWLHEYFGSLIDGFSDNVVSTSAIRMKPLRTYTPGTEKKDGEGSHVPFELAKLQRMDELGWKVMRNQLEKFGYESKMFDEIRVRNFGESGSDPFQIQFDFQGFPRNITDLGYGTSQILPILYNTAASVSSNEKTSFLIQQPEVHLHPKAQAVLAQYFIESFTDHGQKFIVETHSDFIVDRIRTAILSKTINKNDVSLLFFDNDLHDNKIHHIELDENGDPVSAPENYRDFFMDEQLRVLGVPCR